MSDNNDLAPNIITYIGVPLAVLGVLPILYNVVKTTSVYMAVKAQLKTAKDRGDLVELSNDYFGGEVEVRLHTFRVTPLPRSSARYWQVSNLPQLPGGSWARFHWDTLQQGQSSQRVKSADQLRQLQVDLSFQELITYLIDLGFVPEPQGWGTLRSRGIWTPVATRLMVTSDIKPEPVLEIAPLYHSALDGRLSLRFTQTAYHVTRTEKLQVLEWVGLGKHQTDTLNTAGSLQPTDPIEQIFKLHHIPKPESIENAKSHGSESMDIKFNVDVAGNVVINNPSIDATHLAPQKTASLAWHASIFAAYAAARHVLMKYSIPNNVINFAKSCSVPYGVLVLLGIVDGRDVPQWDVTRLQTPVSPWSTRLSPDSSSGHLSKSEIDDLQQQLGDQLRQERGRQKQRLYQALQSRSWDVRRVADHSLHWLNQRLGHTHERMEIVALTLSRMIQEPQLSDSLTAMLINWQDWSDKGGMSPEAIESLQHDEKQMEIFVLSSLLIDMICEYEGTLVDNMQKCFDSWEVVRLG